MRDGIQVHVELIAGDLCHLDPVVLLAVVGRAVVVFVAVFRFPRQCVLLLHDSTEHQNAPCRCLPRVCKLVAVLQMFPEPFATEGAGLAVSGTPRPRLRPVHVVTFHASTKEL